MFDNVSGNKGIIETPIGDVECGVSYAYRHFVHNTHNTNRENIKGGFFKTFKDPLFIVEQAREGQSSPSIYFYKPFFGENKKLMNLFVIGIDSSGIIKFKTYYFDEHSSRINQILNGKNIRIIYVEQ